MTIDTLLTSLDGVRETGHGKFIARCPAHDDRSPSLSLTDGDGCVLIHCFAGCEPSDVLAAMGLSLYDLYDKPLDHHRKPLRQRFDARQVLATLDHESLVVAIIGADFLQHHGIDDDTWSRLTQAVQRINTARAIVSPLRHRK